jgi:hypothetical protein
MSETVDVAGRLRAANPVPGLPRIAPPAGVLAQITATPRAGSARRRRHALIRRPLLAACLGLLALCGIVLAASISVRYFESASKAPPSSVRKALAVAASERYPTDQVELANIVTAYVFTSTLGSGTVYMAPYVHRDGFCAALAVPAKPVQAGCAFGGAIATVSSGGYQPWDFALTPDVHALLGRLAPRAAGDTVEISFEDGGSEPVPMHGRWFAYAAAGKRTMAGHRPTQLTVLAGDRVVRRESLQPTTFNTLAAARALVPAGDGSRGQAAIRRYLLGRIESRSGDGGDIASHTDISQTALVASLPLAEGVRVSVYAAPVRGVHGANGTILVGLDNRYRQPLMTFWGIDGRRGSRFESAGSCTCVPPNSASSFSFLYGMVPRNVSAVSVRTSDDREHHARLFDGGRQWVWIGLAERPSALIGRAASGAVVTTLPLRGPR